MFGLDFLTCSFENKPRRYFKVISCPEAFYFEELINKKIKSTM